VATKFNVIITTPVTTPTLTLVDCSANPHSVYILATKHNSISTQQMVCVFTVGQNSISVLLYVSYICIILHEVLHGHSAWRRCTSQTLEDCISASKTCSTGYSSISLYKRVNKALFENHLV